MHDLILLCRRPIAYLGYADARSTPICIFHCVLPLCVCGPTVGRGGGKRKARPPPLRERPPAAAASSIRVTRPEGALSGGAARPQCLPATPPPLSLTHTGARARALAHASDGAPLTLNPCPRRSSSLAAPPSPRPWIQQAPKAAARRQGRSAPAPAPAAG